MVVTRHVKREIEDPWELFQAYNLSLWRTVVVMDVRVRWEIIKLTSTIIIWRIIRPIGNDLRGSQQSANYLATDTHSAFTICPERTVRREQATTLWKQSADNGLGTLLVPVGCAPISAYYLQLHWEALYLFILARQLLASSSASISIVWKYKFIPCLLFFCWSTTQLAIEMRRWISSRVPINDYWTEAAAGDHQKQRGL